MTTSRRWFLKAFTLLPVVLLPLPAPEPQPEPEPEVVELLLSPDGIFTLTDGVTIHGLHTF